MDLSLSGHRIREVLKRPAGIPRKSFASFMRLSDKLFRSTLLPLIVLHLLLSLAAIVYGLDFTYSPAWRGALYRFAAAVWILGLIALLVLGTTGSRKPVSDCATNRAAAVLCVWQLSLTLFFNLPTLHAGISILALAAVCAGLAWRFGAKGAMTAALVAGFCMFAGSLWVIPQTGPHADMLPVILHAIDQFQLGRDPYLVDYSSVTSNPFFYPPTQWLIFLPLRWMDTDIRLLNLFSAIAIVGLIEWQARCGYRGLRAGIYPLLLSPLVFPMMHSGQVWPYWLCIISFGLLFLHSRWAWAAAVLALAIGMRQTAVIPAAVAFIGLARQVRLVPWLSAGAVGAIVLVVTTLPFMTSTDAWHVMLVDGPRRALASALAAGNPADQMAASNILNWLGYGRFNTMIEACIALGAIVLMWRYAPFSPRIVLIVAGIGYALAVSANPYLHRYYYVAGLLLFTMGLMATSDEKSPERSALPKQGAA